MWISEWFGGFLKVCTFLTATVLLWVDTSKSYSSSLSSGVVIKSRLVCIRPLMKLRNTKSGWPDCLGSQIESNAFNPESQRMDASFEVQAPLGK